MNAVGIDVSKGKSKVAVVQPGGVMVCKPYDVSHTVFELNELADFILSLDGETRVVLEHTGRYSEPVVNILSKAGVFVCAVNAKLMHDYAGGGNTIRRDRTDKIDSIKIARYCLDKWENLSQYKPEDEDRKTLKVFNRQLSEYMKIKIMLTNNLIALLDQVFPGVNKLFTSPARESDGHEKWIDFVGTFYHSDCVSSKSLGAFSERYEKWCHRNGYSYSYEKAVEIYQLAKQSVTTLSRNSFEKSLVTNLVLQINSLCETIACTKHDMTQIASELPEYDIVLDMHGVGKNLAPQLIAEIGEISRFPKRSSLARFAGIEPPANQSGTYNQHSRRISKQGSPHLRKALFMVMKAVLLNKNLDQPTFQFIDKKRSEGKPYKVYMIAGANKFLRIYYARVMECYELSGESA